MTERDEPDPNLVEQWREQRLAAFDATVPPTFTDALPMPAEICGWLERVTAGETANLLLLGPVGTGKTHLAWTVARAYIAAVPSHVEIITAFDLARLVRGDDTHDAIDRLSRVHLLVLDDLGSSALTAWVDDALYAIVDQRYAWQRPTVITSNRANLRDVVGERTASRLASGAVVVPLKGSDRRRESS